MALMHFPTYTSRFIGRESDASFVAEAVRSHQLVSLVGTSGTGKTRLSYQIAQQVEDSFPDTCFFVSLAAIAKPELVMSTIASVLDIQLTDEAPPQEHLQVLLASRRCFLVLDNMEQVTAAAPDIQTLLEHCPQVHILVTSQEPLRLAQETVIRIPPLDFPTDTSNYTPAELQTFPAVALFIDRLKQIQPTFELNQQNTALVKDICHYLHGLPLALELVAANARQLHLRDVLLLLKNYLPPVTSPTSLKRSDIIQPVLDWCHKIMPPALQRIYPQFGVFHGGWNSSIAEQICDTLPGWNIASVMNGLVARHLVLVETLPDATERYSMVDAVVEDARQRLETMDQADALSKRHAAAFEQFAVHADAQSRKQHESTITWYDRLECERANLRAALTWASEHQQFEQAGNICAALSRFWMTRGNIHEAREWLELVYTHQQELTPELVAGLQYGSGLIYFRLGRHADAEHMWEQSLVWHEAQNDPAWRSRLYNSLAVIASNRSDFQKAREGFMKAREMVQELGDQYQEVLLTANIALSYARQSQHEAAIRMYEEAQAKCDVLAQQRSMDDIQASLIGNMGCCYVQLSEYDTGIHMLETSIKLHHETGLQRVATMYHYLALAHIRRQEFAEAYPLIKPCFEERRASHNMLEIAYCLELLCEWFMAQNAEDAAIHAWMLATSIRNHINIPRNEYNVDSLTLGQTLDKLMADQGQQVPAFDQDLINRQLDTAFANYSASAPQIAA